MEIRISFNPYEEACVIWLGRARDKYPKIEPFLNGDSRAFYRLVAFYEKAVIEYGRKFKG